MVTVVVSNLNVLFTQIQVEFPPTFSVGRGFIIPQPSLEPSRWVWPRIRKLALKRSWLLRTLSLPTKSGNTSNSSELVN